jgi:Zn-dependent peptidase ImmA (M78 family)/transcriptional regulator with XRE-family HTH domain
VTASDRVPVAPTVVAWARDSAGLRPDEAARRLGVSLARLQQWESGELEPTIKQLRRAANLYGRPLAVLLLPTPPRDFDSIHDFRLTTDHAPRTWSHALRMEYRRILGQRDVFLELAELAPSTVPQPQPITIEDGTHAEAAGNGIREVLGITREQQSEWANPDDALRAWIAAAERLAILVVHTRSIEVSEMRGFSVSEWPFPVVALNGSDSRRGRLFTLAHELCHIALNSGGLCDLHESQDPRELNDRLEQYCNEAAASALMPRDAMLTNPVVRQADRGYRWSLDELRALSRRYGVSSEAFLIRLIGLGKASWDLYWSRKPQFEAEYAEARRRQRDEPGGPSYYVVKARDLGRGYVTAVIDAFHSRVISSLDVADYLDIRFDQLNRLEQAALR